MIFSETIQTVTDWEMLAHEIAPSLQAGDVLALSGPLGAGKTTFTQALARVLGATVDPRSPTFALMRAYPLSGQATIKRLLHIDAYRLEKPEDLLALNLEEELLEAGTVIVIEWPENLSSWFARREKYYWMTIIPKEDQVREVRFEQRGK